MSEATRADFWNGVYAARAETGVSWFQENPAPSLDLLRLVGAGRDAAIIDIGGGASRLVDHLLAQGHARVAVLDVSDAALAAARARLGDAARAVRWIVADVTRWAPDESYDVWHDRAALHFLNAAEDQRAYVCALKQALRVGGHAIIAGFAPDGPEKCSGLPVTRHDAASLATLLGDGFTLIDARRRDHATPWGAVQRFQFSAFRRDA